jgi:copper chaperone
VECQPFHHGKVKRSGFNPGLDLAIVASFTVHSMIQFNIQSMSCGHCVKAVTEAVKSVDPQAQVDVDLAAKRVAVESQAAREKLVEALVEAGYTPA